MDVYILGRDYNAVGVLDYCSSIIWTRRYCNVGDFELYIPATQEAIALCKIGNLAQRADRPKSLMRIDTVKLSTNEESGDYLTVSGRGIEGMLSWRIVWNQTNLSGLVTAAVHQLLNENLIAPAIAERRVDGLVLGEPCACSITIQKQITGTNLLDAVKDLLESYNLGFKMEFEGGSLVFSVYEGVDRSMRQTDRPPVVFSIEYDNLLSTEYDASTASYKNVALVAGEGEGVARRTYAVGAASGLDRFEVYVDARDISSETDAGTIAEAEYNALLEEQGKEALAEAVATQAFSGTIEPNTNAVFEIDYNIGDVVQITNEYGISSAARIVEMIESWDENGYNCTPTLDSKEV